MHTEADVEEAERAIRKARQRGYNTKSCASKYWGIKNERVIRFNREHIIPCNLHCFMGIMRKLFVLLAREIEDSPSGSAAMREILLTHCKVKVSTVLLRFCWLTSYL